MHNLSWIALMEIGVGVFEVLFLLVIVFIVLMYRYSKGELDIDESERRNDRIYKELK